MIAELSLALNYWKGISTLARLVRHTGKKIVDSKGVVGVYCNQEVIR